MLPGEDLGRRHQHGLTPGLYRRGHGEQRHRRLARPDIALEQAQHPARSREVGADLLHRPGLSPREPEGQALGQPRDEAPRHPHSRGPPCAAGGRG